jgi:hypothetical protein
MDLAKGEGAGMKPEVVFHWGVIECVTDKWMEL